MSQERSSSRWVEVTVTVAAGAAEATGAELLGLGASGLVDADGWGRSLTAYYPDPEGTAGERLAGEIRRFLARLPDWGLDPGPGAVTFRRVDETDWRDQWKAFFRPVRVGRRLVVHPPWELPKGAGPGDRLIVIDPGQAFGTGGHATTRGALELLEEAMDSAGDGGGMNPVLDLGAGSGILAVAAAKLGASRVLAVDNDPVAVAAARENVAANGVSAAVTVETADVFEVVGRFAVPVGPGSPGEPVGSSVPGEPVGPSAPAGPPRLILANLTTEMIITLLEPASRTLAAGGRLICAGVSEGEAAARVSLQAGRVGLTELGRREGEGWTSFLFRVTVPPTGSTAVFYTLGCKANLYDTAGMMEDLRASGWNVAVGNPATAAGKAALCVINSCAVTARAESKSRYLARRARRAFPEALVVLVGCYPQVDPDGASGIEGVDIILGTGDRVRLPEILRERGLPGRADPPVPPGDAGTSPAPCPSAAGRAGDVPPGAFAGDRTRAFVKVQDGCDQLCTYCVIPLARGPSRSRPTAEVREEVAGLVRAGFKEVVLTGIHLGAWGTGRAPHRLVDLLTELLAVPGLARLRLSSIEPHEVDDDLIELMAVSGRLCRHLHLPLQSGSQAVLRRMNRHYTETEYLDVVARIRDRVPLVGLTTDVMVGFPGETEDDFAQTLEVVKRARFSRLHVFRYSRRPGTPAASFPDQVPPAVMKARGEELIALGRRLEREVQERLVGLTLEVLVERAAAPARGRRSRAEGFTDNYVRVAIDNGGARPNDIVPVLLERAGPRGMRGRSLSGAQDAEDPGGDGEVGQ